MPLKELDESFNGNVLSFPNKADIREARDVEKINIFNLYTMGHRVHGLKEMSKDHPLDAYFALVQAKSSLAAALEQSELQLKFCLHEAQELEKEINVLIGNKFTDKDGKVYIPEQYALEDWEVYSLKNALERFETNFSAELREAATYFVHKTGIYDTADLVDAAEKHVPEICRFVMSETAKNDFHDAGRCLAFN